MFGRINLDVPLDSKVGLEWVVVRHPAASQLRHLLNDTSSNSLIRKVARLFYIHNVGRSRIGSERKQAVSIWAAHSPQRTERM